MDHLPPSHPIPPTVCMSPLTSTEVFLFSSCMAGPHSTPFEKYIHCSSSAHVQTLSTFRSTTNFVSTSANIIVHGDSCLTSSVNLQTRRGPEQIPDVLLPHLEPVCDACCTPHRWCRCPHTCPAPPFSARFTCRATDIW